MKFTSSETVTVEPSHLLFTKFATKLVVEVGQIFAFSTALLETTVAPCFQLMDCNKAPFGKKRQH